MRITIDHTDTFATVGGVQCRLWQGKTEGGIAVTAIVNGLLNKTEDEGVVAASPEFAELAATAPPEDGSAPFGQMNLALVTTRVPAICVVCRSLGDPLAADRSLAELPKGWQAFAFSVSTGGGAVADGEVGGLPGPYLLCPSCCGSLLQVLEQAVGALRGGGHDAGGS